MYAETSENMINLMCLERQEANFIKDSIRKAMLTPGLTLEEKKRAERICATLDIEINSLLPGYVDSKINQK